MTQPIEILPSVYAVELPENATDVVIDGELYYKSNWYGMHIGQRRKLPPGEWQLLFVSDEVTEKLAAKIVEHRYEYGNSKSKGVLIAKDYTNGLSKHTCIESFASLLTSHNIEGRVAVIKKVNN